MTNCFVRRASINLCVMNGAVEIQSDENKIRSAAAGGCDAGGCFSVGHRSFTRNGMVLEAMHGFSRIYRDSPTRCAKARFPS